MAVQAFCFATLVAQNQTDKEIQAVVSNLITQLNGKKSVKKIIILDFTDTEGGANKLGNYLTEELSIAMSSVPKNFSISDKSILAKGTVTSKSPNNVATTTGQVINQANQTAVKNNLITSEKATTAQAVGDAVTLLGNLNIFKKSTNKLKN